MTHTSLAGSPPSGLGNHKGLHPPTRGQQEDGDASSEPEESKTCQSRDTGLVVKQASWLLPGRLYPAESWVGIGYIGDGPG